MHQNLLNIAFYSYVKGYEFLLLADCFNDSDVAKLRFVFLLKFRLDRGPKGRKVEDVKNIWGRLCQAVGVCSRH